MEEAEARKNILDSKVGSSCFLMNVSGIFELKKVASLQLIYTNFDFIYNPECFTVFINPKPTEEYVSKDNKLILNPEINSLFCMDYRQYTNTSPKNMDAFDVKRIDPEILDNLDELKYKYCDNNIPVIFTGDHYYLYYDYKDTITNMMHYHGVAHSAILLDIYEDSCLICDKFFGYVGKIKLETLKKAIASEYNLKKQCSIVEINENTTITEEERVRILFKDNIERSLQEYEIVNDTKYYKNVRAIEKLIDNFDKDIISIMEQKGEYAPQFYTNTFKQVMLNKRGFCDILKYVSSITKIEIVYQISNLCKEITGAWFNLDMMCDKCYLSNSKLIDYKDRFQKLYTEILELEKKLLGLYEKVYVKL